MEQEEKLLSALIQYSNTLAIFIALITVIVSLVALVKDKRLNAILTGTIVFIRFPISKKFNSYRLTMQTLMRNCVVISAFASILLLGVFVAQYYNIKVNILFFKRIVAAAQIFALILFFIISPIFPK